MKLLFKQRLFSWFDSYDIYDGFGNTVFTVKGKMSLGHCLHIHNAAGEHMATLQQRLLTLLPKFEMYLGDTYVGCIRKEFTFFHPKFTLDCNGWSVEGAIMEWDYRILDGNANLVAMATKELMHLTDTYVIDVDNPDNALPVLMIVLAIDAEKDSRSN